MDFEELKKYKITVDNILSSGWEKIIPNGGLSSYSDYFTSFRTAAIDAYNKGDYINSRVFRLLSDICSYYLEVKSINDPFKPIFVMNGVRSPIPDDLSAEEVNLLTEFLERIDDDKLKARIVDISWLLSTPRNFQYALIAIDSYLKFPLDFKSLISFSANAWKRAIGLSISLGKGGMEKVVLIKKTLVDYFLNHEFKESFHAYWIVGLLELLKLEKDEVDKIIFVIKKIADLEEFKLDFNRKRKYLESSIRLLEKSGNLEIIANFKREIADSLISEANLRGQLGPPLNMSAASLFEEAVFVLRSISNNERSDDDKKLIQSTHDALRESNKLLYASLKRVPLGTIDIRESIEASRNRIKGQSKNLAIENLANIITPISIERIVSASEENQKHSFFRNMFSYVHLTRDGRSAAKREGIFSAKNSVNEALKIDVISSYLRYIDLYVRASIFPALEVFQLEHRITEKEIQDICEKSPYIAFNRTHFWSKAFYFGFESDFISALHLLIPQVEHFIREMMKKRGLKTSVLDNQGIETESGLGTLLEHPDIHTAIEKDLVFELKAILTEPTGLNLRNNIAHGLAEYHEVMSVYGLYFWWFCFAFIYNSAEENSLLDDQENVPNIFKRIKNWLKGFLNL